MNKLLEYNNYCLQLLFMNVGRAEIIGYNEPHYLSVKTLAYTVGI